MGVGGEVISVLFFELCAVTEILTYSVVVQLLLL